MTLPLQGISLERIKEKERKKKRRIDSNPIIILLVAKGKQEKAKRLVPGPGNFLFIKGFYR